MTDDDFRAALEAHRTKFPNPWDLDAQAALRTLHLSRADALEATGDPSAMAHLRAAEDCQWRLGSEATSAGEGLSSMGALYVIRARRAKLAEKAGDFAEALDLWESIAADPNDLGRFAVPEVARIKART